MPCSKKHRLWGSQKQRLLGFIQIFHCFEIVNGIKRLYIKMLHVIISAYSIGAYS